MSLVKEITKHLLSEEKKREIAVYGGGFKPPTDGHFEVVKTAMKKNPNIDKFIILIGGKEREGVTSEDSILIWDIYKKYLPIKTEIKLSTKPPIQAVYNYAKEHPEELVLFVIGAREGNEDDFKDITIRTKSVNNYPNLKVETVITQAGASGTAARNASKISFDKFKSFLPKELTEEEKEEVYNILTGKVTEIIKEVLDPKTFDFKSKIKSLTKSMEADGLKLKPYPKVRFIHDEEFNADDFFGKTAYYEPNTNEVVLYTLGRHPKDIMRSYAHELIHVHQNHENRLNNINTTDVNEDDYLEKIEREAYENGNIMFRSWTNKLTEVLTEGKYDSLVTKLAGYTLNAWKGDFEDKQRKGYFEVEVGPNKEFNYPHLDFYYKAHVVFDNNVKYRDSGTAKPFVPEVAIKFIINKTDLPKIWEKVAMDLRNIIRHEITHLMQAGPNVKKGKEMDDDSDSREELESGKKPWWKIWRRKLGTPDYYKLEKEIDANLQGLYLQAKKSRQPLEKVIDDYLEFKLKLPPKEREDIKLLWKKRAPKLSIPLQEFSLSPDIKSIVDKLYGTTEKAGKKLLELIKKESKQTIYAIKEIAEWVVKGEKPNEAEQKKIIAQIKDFGYLASLALSSEYKIFAALYYIIDKSNIADEFLKLDEGKNKDPFGLNAYALELAKGLEEQESDYKVYLDMDGVVANFDKRFEDLSGMKPNEFEEKYGKNKFWDFIDEDHKVSFWVGIPVMDGAKKLVDYVKKYNYELLTAPSVKKQSYLGKILWVRNHSDLLGGKPRINFKKAKSKHEVKDELTKFDIIIDDRADTVGRWKAKGGTGIVYKSTDQVINDLKKIGL